VHGVRHPDPAAGAGRPSPKLLARLGPDHPAGPGDHPGRHRRRRLGRRQEGRDLSPDQKKAAVAEFDFKKGIAVAIFSGIMSACFAFGLAAGEPIKALSARPAPARCGPACRPCAW
jgi:hypothetical protein